MWDYYRNQLPNQPWILLSQEDITDFWQKDTHRHTFYLTHNPDPSPNPCSLPSVLEPWLTTPQCYDSPVSKPVHMHTYIYTHRPFSPSSHPVPAPQIRSSRHSVYFWEKFHLVELNILIQNSSKQPKSSLLLTFRPLSEAFIRRSWY